MPNITSVLNDQIHRLSRREIKSQTKTARKQTAQYRRDIAALKRQIKTLARSVKLLEKHERRDRGNSIASVKDTTGLRLRVDGLKAHRARLGLSAVDYGKLIGVSGLTIYNWETKKSKPRRSQLGRIAAVRGIGKREAMRRLDSK